MKNVMKRLIPLSLVLCLLMALALTGISASAEENEGLYKPSVANEILFWGSNAVSAKNQTVKFTARLNSPSENYNKSQIWVSLRAENMGNPWDGVTTGYYIMIDNTATHVRYGGADIFYTCDDQYASVPGYSETRWTLTAMEEAAGSRTAFWSAEHEFEFSAINEEGGVRLTAKMDGNVILNWLDTESRVDKAGGFSVRTEDVYELYGSALSFTGDDGVEINMLTAENVEKLSTNTTGFGGYVNPITQEDEDPTPVDDPPTPDTGVATTGILVAAILASILGVLAIVQAAKKKGAL